MDFRVIIPARYASTRLPGKMLLDIAGKPMIQHVYERSLQSGAESVVIATDDERIQKAAEGFGATVVMTDPGHISGTERVAEAVQALECEDDEIIINVQGDEALVPPESIAEVAADLAAHENVKCASICSKIIDPADLFNPSVVKVVLSKRGFAMYFSRAPIPFDREHFDMTTQTAVVSDHHYRHAGLYAYRAGFLNQIIEWENCPCESLESLEQLRILWNGGRMHMRVTQQDIPGGVDTQEDLDAVCAVY